MRTLLAMSIVLVTSCKSQKVIEVETEIAAAKSRVAALDKKRQELTTDLKRLQIERKTFGQQADEAALARERLNAAYYALTQKPLPDGIQLDEALRAKSPTLGKLAAEIVQRQLPCIDESDAPSDADGQGDCSPPPLADACEGVSETSTQAFAWNCKTLPANGKVPALALCLSRAELAASDYPPTVSTNHLEGDVVRMAYEKKGRLFVADWPPPSMALYEPENYAELATCQSENDNAQCVRTCDERWGKLGGCGDWGGDGYEGEGGDADGDEEPYELRAAREAAAREEREAQEARDELSYQECVAACGSPETEEEVISHVSLEYKSTPAPGLYQFAVKGQNEEGKATETNTLLISFMSVHDELAGNGEPGEEDTVGDLNTVLNVRKIIEGKVTDGERVLAGLTTEDLPTAARITMDGTKPPVKLDLDQTCAFADELKNTLLQERCVVAKKQRDEQKAKDEARVAAEAAKKAAKLDGGVGDAGTVAVATPTPSTSDAGVTP